MAREEKHREGGPPGGQAVPASGGPTPRAWMCSLEGHSRPIPKAALVFSKSVTSSSSGTAPAQSLCGRPGPALCGSSEECRGEGDRGRAQAGERPPLSTYPSSCWSWEQLGGLHKPVLESVPTGCWVTSFHEGRAPNKETRWECALGTLGCADHDSRPKRDPAAFYMWPEIGNYLTSTLGEWPSKLWND